MGPSRFPLRWFKVVLFLSCLAPLGWLGWAVWRGVLGANPIEAVIHHTGDWTLRLLLATLAMTPLRRLFAWRWPLRVRRMLGLFTFFYGMLHLSAYVVLDQFFHWPAIWADIAKRPYITVGFTALLLMLPLAVTSTAGWMRRLGRRWVNLHRLVYPIAILGVLHYWWLVKADWRLPALHGGVLALLLGVRLWWRFSPPQRPPGQP